MNKHVSFNLPAEIITILLPFAQLFSTRVWNHVQILLVGSILAIARTTPLILGLFSLATLLADHLRHEVSPKGLLRFSLFPI